MEVEDPYHIADDELTYVFSFGSNHPVQLSERIGTTVEDLLNRSVACTLQGY